MTNETSGVAEANYFTVVDTAGEFSVYTVINTAYDTAGVGVNAFDVTVVGSVYNLNELLAGVSGVVEVEDTGDTAGAV